MFCAAFHRPSVCVSLPSHLAAQQIVSCTTLTSPLSGFFWTCPNGGQACKYRHALPPGFVLKSQRKKDEAAEKAKEISLEVNQLRV